MKIYAKDVAPLGFKGSGMFDNSKWYHFYYAKCPKSRRVYIIDAIENSISHFELDKKDWKAFVDGKLSLVPEGCCCASGGRFRENPIFDFMGEWKSVFGSKEKALEFVRNIMRG